MKKKVITIEQDDNTDRAIDVMKKNKISILPVVDKDGNLVGIVGVKELLRESSESDEFLFG